MKRRLTAILFMILLSACSNKNLIIKEEVKVGKETASSDILEGKDEESNNIIKDMSDPLLYIKNIDEENDIYSWRTRSIQYSGTVDCISKEYLSSTIWLSSDDEFQKPPILVVFYNYFWYLIIVFALIMVFTKNNKSEGLKTGKYVIQDSEYEGLAWVLLEENNEFE